MLRLLVCLLCAVTLAGAEPAYCKWLLTAANLNLDHAGPKSEKETWKAGPTSYEYVYDDYPRMIRCRVTIFEDDAGAKVAFTGGRLALGMRHPPKGYVQQDFSPTIRAGDQSQCVRSTGHGFESWIFIYRQDRVAGSVLIRNIPLKPKRRQALIYQWVQRASAAVPQ